MSVKHVVLIKFKEGVSPAETERAWGRLRALKGKIPQVLSFEGGTNVSKEGRSKGYTHGFVMTLQSQQAVTQYLEHPEHTRVVEELLPILDDVVVVDFEV